MRWIMNYVSSNKKQSDTSIGNGIPVFCNQKHKGYKDKPCKECEKSFTPLAPSHRYCSQECADKSYTSSYLRRNYGITYDEWLSLYVSQGGRCKICGSTGFKLHDNCQLLLVVDHNHKTGDIRGMLCHNCNRALGLLQDSEHNLRSALLYLEGATTISKESTLK